MRETQRERQTRREKQSKRESESQVKRGRPNTPLLPFPVSRSPTKKKKKKKKNNQFVGRNLCVLVVVDQSASESGFGITTCGDGGDHWGPRSGDGRNGSTTHGGLQW
jgi:hypothetical protein